MRRKKAFVVLLSQVELTRKAVVVAPLAGVLEVLVATLHVALCLVFREGVRQVWTWVLTR
jgi:hypothetical protein